MTEPIRVLIADDHALFREGIRQVLASAPGFEVVAETGDGTEVLALVDRTRPDVALLDISMPGRSGIELAAAIRRGQGQTRVLILSVHDNAEYVLESVRAGARGYLRKDTSPAELWRAIRAVAAGEDFFSAAVSQRLADALRGETPNHESAATLKLLTPREREVLTGVVSGDTNREIAAALGISPRTVETHRESLMRKLGIRTVAGLTRFAVASGLNASASDPTP